jgi:uncharacterized protein (TIGR00297 family)
MRHDLWLAIAVAAALTVPVILARAATLGGTIAGFLHAGWFAWEGGLEVILAFVALVALGVAATRAGRPKKEGLGAAQAAGGRRAARHVFANAGPAALFLVAGALLGDEGTLFRTAACAALAGSLADTVAGEIGMLSPETPRMLLVGPAVRRGVDGGMTFVGLAASAVASAVVGALVAAGGVLAFWPAFAGGMTGSIADSVLGATAERARLIGNEGVNFWSSAAAGAVGAACAWMSGT